MDREMDENSRVQKLNNVKEENGPPTREENVRKYAYIQKLRLSYYYGGMHNHYDHNNSEERLELRRSG
ncbi:hypothetical protein GB937_008543 [Aspergillus fischeri]|nr:hypothetical protein GB937_008543 [Aspergillus fischeri]